MMSTDHIFLFLVFALFVFTTCVEINKDLLRCGDCTAANVNNCIIENDTGYYVYPESADASFTRTKQSDIPRGTSNLSECIPKNMKIEGIESGINNTYSKYTSIQLFLYSF